MTHDIDEAVYLSHRVVVLTKNPATVQEVVNVTLGDERDQILTSSTPELGALRGHILGLIRESQLAAAS